VAMIVGPAEVLAYERYRAARRRYPGASGHSFRSTPKGWVVRPRYSDGKASARNAGSWQQQAVALEQRLLELQLQAISRTL
jgi:hypothetical protein